MSTPLPATLGSELQLTQVSNPATEPPVCTCDETTTGALFKDILADEHLLSDVISNLKKLLSEEEFSKIEELLESGNDLPIAAIFSSDSELLEQLPAAIPQIMQEVVKLDGQLASSFIASAQKLSDSITPQLKNAPTRALEAMGRHISETVSTTNSVDTANTPGKQIQELLTTVKAEFPLPEVIPKALVPASMGSEVVTPSIPNINSALSGLAQMSTFQAGGTTQLPAPIIAQPLGEQGWSEAMGERIMWMMGKGMQAASIRITPPHLGPIQVQLSVQNDQASVNMVAQHGVVKEALEAAMPRLREMLAESNMQLVNVDVSHRENTQHGSSSDLAHRDHAGHSEQLNEKEDMVPMEEQTTRYYTSSGLLDDYA